MMLPDPVNTRETQPESKSQPHLRRDISLLGLVATAVAAMVCWLRVPSNSGKRSTSARFTMSSWPPG
jgi:hypothetical protein